MGGGNRQKALFLHLFHSVFHYGEPFGQAKNKGISEGKRSQKVIIIPTCIGSMSEHLHGTGIQSEIQKHKTKIFFVNRHKVCRQTGAVQ